MQKITSLLKIVWCFVVLLCAGSAAAQQVYVHDFGTTPINTHPYTIAPGTLDSHLTGSTWSNSTGDWFSYNGSSGEALGIANSSGTPTMTLSFTVQPGYQLAINSFSFWRQRSNSGATAWSMTINGIPVGSGTVAAGNGISTGTLNVSQPVTGLTGQVNVVLRLSGASGAGTFRIDDFTLNGSITGTCVSPSVTSMEPATGPYNTVVTLNGSGFNVGTGTSAVTFNGVPAAGFTVVSDNIIKAVVPEAATTGPISIITNGCAGNTGTFTVINGNCPTTALPSDLYISEIYDQNLGDGGMIEIYNASGAPITFNGQYVLQRYANSTDNNPTNGYIFPLTGTIAAEGVLLFGSANTGSSQCNVPSPTGSNSWSGINNNDKIELLKNGTVIDVVITPATQPGFTMIRKPDAIAPSGTYNAAEWNITLHPVPTPTPNTYCADLGNHSVTTGEAREITAQPFSQSVCENDIATYTLTINDAAGFNYQWKVLNSAGNWVNISDDANYSGTNSAQLVINNTPLSFLGNQYYCVISNGTCTLVSNAVQLTVSPLPVVALAITQPTCTTPTGSVVITPSVGDASLTYSTNGTTYTSSTTLTGLQDGNYTLYVKSGSNCISTTPFTIIPAAGTPDAPVTTVTQPTCTTPSGSIVVTAPIGDYTYSIDGTNFQEGTSFTGLSDGGYTVTVKDDVSGCTSTSSVTINPAPAVPTTPQFVVVQPTCLTAGTVTVTSPVGLGYSYSLGGDFQSLPLFTGVASGSYTLTVRNADNCTSTASVVVDPVPNAPLAAEVTVQQPTCTNPTATITITNYNPLFTYSIGAITSQGAQFTNIGPGVYTITTLNVLGCVTVSATITVNPAPGAPAVAQFAVTQPTCATPTGTIAITSPDANATYTLTGGSTTQTGTSFSGLAAGSYTITTDVGGCTSTTGTITINPVPGAPAVASFTVTQPTCATPTGTIAITSPDASATYTLVSGSTTQTGTSFSGLAAGSYTITTDVGGCTSTTGTITINSVPGAPAVALFTVTQPTCAIPTGTIAITSPDANATYTLTGGSTTQTGTSFSGLAAGSYTITTDVGGCTSTTGTITINAAPTTPAVAQFTITQPTCATPTGTIAITSPDASATYTLVSGSTTQTGTSFSGLAAGSYTITTDIGGCTSTTGTITINPVPGAPAVASFTVTQPTCAIPTGTIAITSPDANATYTLTSGSTTQTGTSFSGLAAGSYTITTNVGGCTSTTGTITINAAPTTPPVASFSVTQPTCAASTGSIQVTPASLLYTYTLTGGSTSQTGTSFTNLASGTYTITTTETATGCTSTTAQIIIDPLPAGPAVPQVTVYHPNCGQTTGALTVTAPTGGVQYSIDGTNFQVSANFSGLQPGPYTITVRDNVTLCTTNSQTVIIDQPVSPPAITSVEGCQETVNGREYLIITSPVAGSFDPAVATYEWRNTQGMLIGSDSTLNLSAYVANPANNVIMDGSMQKVILTITLPGGCTTTQDFEFDSVFCSIPKGISPGTDGKNDKFDLTGFNARKVSIFNRYGREVYTRANYVNEWVGQSNNGDELPTGTYYYVIETASNTQTGWVYINRPE